MNDKCMVMTFLLAKKFVIDYQNSLDENETINYFNYIEIFLILKFLTCFNFLSIYVMSLDTQNSLHFTYFPIYGK